MPADWNLAIGQTLSSWSRFPQLYATVAGLPREKPLLVSGAFRSGTSWLGDLLTTEGTWHLHEPFNPRAGFLARNFVYRRSDEPDSAIDTYVHDLLSGRKTFNQGVSLLQGIAVNRAFMPARLGLFRGAPRRVLIKDPIACLLTEYLVRNHDFRTLLILRHPAGFVSSLQKLGWDTASEIKMMLLDEKLMADWLAPYAQVLEHGTHKPGVISHATLYAAIWQVLHGFTLRTSDIAVISYEALCADVLGVTQSLFQQYELGELNPEKLEFYMSQNSGDGDAEGTSPHSLARETAKMSGIWRKRLGKEAVGATRRIWAQFNLPYYCAENEWRT